MRLTTEEADNYQSNNGGVLADVVDTHVKADQDDCNGQTKQTQCDHRLHGMEPVCTKRQNTYCTLQYCVKIYSHLAVNGNVNEISVSVEYFTLQRFWYTCISQ